MDRFDEAFERAHGITANGIRLDEPDYSMLTVDEESFLEHLKVQAAGLAYYSSLAKAAARALEDLERRYRYRYNEMYAECADIQSRATGRVNAREVEALMRSKYESELDRWDASISEAKAKKDGVESFYEGWKAKGFSLNSMTSLVTSNLLTPKTSITEDDMRKGRMGRDEASSILAMHRAPKDRK